MALDNRLQGATFPAPRMSAVRSACVVSLTFNSAESQRVACRFYKAHIMGCVGDLAADVTIMVRVKAAHVLSSIAERAQILGDAELGLKAEGLRKEFLLTTLQHDASSSTSACMEVWSSLHGLSICLA